MCNGVAFSLSTESSFIPGESYKFKKELPKVSSSVSSGRKCEFTECDIIISAECNVEQKKVERTEVDHKWDEAEVDNSLDDIGDLEDDFLGFVVHDGYMYVWVRERRREGMNASV